MAVGVPSAKDRADILSIHARSLRLKAEVDLCRVAADCAGFTGADLAALCREAAVTALLEGTDVDSLEGTEARLSSDHSHRPLASLPSHIPNALLSTSSPLIRVKSFPSV